MKKDSVAIVLEMDDFGQYRIMTVCPIVEGVTHEDIEADYEGHIVVELSPEDAEVITRVYAYMNIIEEVKHEKEW